MKRLGLVAILALALGGWSACSTGSVTLKAQSVTVDTLVLAGETFFLVGDAFNTMCPAKVLSVDACRGFRLFTDGNQPTAPLCKAPTLMAIGDVLNQCGYRVAYPMVVKAYQEKKESMTAVSSAAESIIKQLTGFSKNVNTVKGKG